MQPFALALLVYSIQLLVLVMVATAAAAAMRLTAPSVRLAYWRGVGVLGLALPLLSTPGAQMPAVSLAFGPAAAAGMPDAPLAPALPPLAPLVVWIYAAGLALHAGRLVLGGLRLRQIRRRSTPAAVGVDLEALRSEIAPDAEIRWTLELRQPVAFGLARPVILLPQRFAALSLEGRRSVLCHELLHVARRDWLWIVLEEHVRVVFWFHPAVRWLLEQVQLSREQVIDQAVLRRAVSKRAYMDALLAFADEGGAASLSMAFLRRHHLKFRLELLSKEAHMSRRRLIWTMAVLVLVTSATAAGIARALPVDVSALRIQAVSEAHLEIRLAETEPAIGLIEVPGIDGRRAIYVHPAALVTTADVTSANPIDAGHSQFSVAIGFSQPAAARMLDATLAHLGRPVAVFLDRQLIAVATVRSPLGDSAVLTGLFTGDQARRIAEGLTATAALPPAAVQAARPNGEGAVITQPVPVVKVNPVYTPAAMAAKIEGRVTMRVEVLADGTVGDVAVTESLDAVHGLDEQAIAAMEEWEFRPATANGKPVAVEVTVEMTFTLK